MGFTAYCGFWHVDFPVKLSCYVYELNKDLMRYCCCRDCIFIICLILSNNAFFIKKFYFVFKVYLVYFLFVPNFLYLYTYKFK